MSRHVKCHLLQSQRFRKDEHNQHPNKKLLFDHIFWLYLEDHGEFGLVSYLLTSKSLTVGIMVDNAPIRYYITYSSLSFSFLLLIFNEMRNLTQNSVHIWKHCTWSFTSQPRQGFWQWIWHKVHFFNIVTLYDLRTSYCTFVCVFVHLQHGVYLNREKITIKSANYEFFNYMVGLWCSIYVWFVA